MAHDCGLQAAEAEIAAPGQVRSVAVGMGEPRARQRHATVVALVCQPIDDRTARVPEAQQLGHLVVGLTRGVVARAAQPLEHAGAGLEVEAGMSARDHEHDGRERHLAATEDQRLDVAGQVMHRDQRHPASPCQRLRKAQPDQQGPDQAGTLRHRDGVVARRSRRPRRPSPPRRRYRGCAAGRTAPAPRRPTRGGCPPATPPRWRGRAMDGRRRRSPRPSPRPSRRRRFRCPGSSWGRQRQRAEAEARRRSHTTCLRAARDSLDTAARAMPRSVTIAVT